MKKTAAEWFNDALPPHLAAAAIRNLTECPDRRAGNEFSTLSSALICSFVWGKSAEGDDFWYSVYDKVGALESEKLPPKSEAWLKVDKVSYIIHTSMGIEVTSSAKERLYDLFSE